MTDLSRRSLLRSGTVLALTAATAGCSGTSDSTAKVKNEIPGVEDGEVDDHHAFASAHHNQLGSRTGTLNWTRVELDSETGEAQSHTVWTVRVEGERVHAVVAGRSPLAGGNQIAESDTTRREFYFGDETTMYYRTRTDGKWETRSAEPNEVALTESDFTGKGMLENPPLTKVGTETVDGEELYRFSHTTRVPDNEQVEWTGIQALVNRDALVHSFHQTLDRTNQNNQKTQRVDEWHLTALDATTVKRPEWVSEADT